MYKLIRPSYELIDKIQEFKSEFLENDEDTIPGSELLDKTDDIREWIRYVSLNSSADTVTEDWVLTDTFLFVEDDIVVGIVSLRHQLNDFLADFGHIGFSVRPSCRAKGIGKIIFKEILEIANEYDIGELQISAAKDNLASRKIIEEFGGLYIRRFKFMNEEVYVYKIHL